MGLGRRLFLLVYFRIVVSAGLENPVAWAGFVGLVAHHSWTSLGVCLSALFVAYALPNGMLFQGAARDKRLVMKFLDRYPNAQFVRVPPEEFRQLFDVSFLVPSYIRPDWLVARLARDRIHVFTVKRGGDGPIFGSATVFVSPLAQDAYVFLRDSLAEMTAEMHFRIAHELGHAAGIYTVTARRNFVGLAGVYLSILWTVVNTTWTPLLISWTAVQLTACIALTSTVFRRYRQRQRFNAELVADYMALRHLSPAAVENLFESGSSATIVHRDLALTPAETALRRQIFTDQLNRLRRGEAIDVPEVYMRDTFSHPWPLSLFILAQTGYVGTFAVLNMPSLVVPCVLATLSFVYLFTAAMKDAEGRVRILTRLTPSASVR